MKIKQFIVFAGKTGEGNGVNGYKDSFDSFSEAEKYAKSLKICDWHQIWNLEDGKVVFYTKI